MRVAPGAVPPATASSGSFVEDVAGARNSTVVAGLSPSTTYTFAVFAHDQVPNYAPSATATVTTTPSGLACTKNWNGPANSSFAVAANWSPARVPAATDTVCAGTGATIVSSASQTVAASQIAGKLTLSYGTFTVTGTARPNTIANLKLAGGVQAGDVTVTSVLDWTGGTMTGAGTTTIPVGATANFNFASNATSGSVTGGHTLINRGTITETTTANGTFVLSGATSRLDNYGTFTTKSAGTVITLNSSSGVFTNQPGGQLTIDPTTGTTTTINTTLNNAGTITIKAGTTLVAPYLVNIP